jgi:predicted metal-dependent hydrolase
MPKVKYGRKEIDFRHEVDDRLKDGYISVDAEEGVVFKSPVISNEEALKHVSKKAGWINKKLNQVAKKSVENISTGSRIMYLGKNYYTEIIQDRDVKEAKVLFTHSKFEIYINPDVEDKQEAILIALEEFYKAKAYEKIMQRINKHIKNTGFEPKEIKVRKLEKRWGSCTKDNTVIYNYEIAKLPFSLMDYVIIHELCHIKAKDHSKEFWNIVGKFVPNYKELEEKLDEAKL